MYDCRNESTDEITMWEHVVEIEPPTNGLDEFIDWDALEKSLAAGEFESQKDFKTEVEAQFEEAGVPFTRGFYKRAIKGLFPEARATLKSLPRLGSTFYDQLRKEVA